MGIEYLKVHWIHENSDSESIGDRVQLLIRQLHLRVLLLHLLIIHIEPKQIVEEQERVFFNLSPQLTLVLLGRITRLTNTLEKRLKVEPAVESFVLVLRLDQTGEIVLSQIL